MSFKLIAVGHVKQIVSFLTMMQTIENVESKLIYKQPLEKNEFLVVWNCKQRHNEQTTYPFDRINVQAGEKEEEICFTLINAKVMDTGERVIHIKGTLE